MVDRRLWPGVRDAIWFGQTERVRLAYRLALDTWQGQMRVQMLVVSAG